MPLRHVSPAVLGVLLLAGPVFGQVEPGMPPAATPTPTPLPSVTPTPELGPLEPITPPRARRVALGYALGNGVVDLVQPGGELLFHPGPHLGFGLQLGRLANGAMSGVGLAPALRLTLDAEGGPYVALGGVWFSVAGGTQKASGLGGFLNVGYEWRASPSFSVFGGAGAGFMPAIAVETAGFASTASGGLTPNLELGARWYAF